MFDIITIGTATRDIFLRSKYFKEFKDKDLKKFGISSGAAECFEWGGKLEVDKPVLTIGGGAANAAVTFVRQGFRAATLFKVGDDRPGEGLVLELKKNKIHTLPLLDKKMGTAYSTILLSHSGERTVLVYRGASSDIKSSEIPYKQLKAKWVYIVPGSIPLGTMKKIFSTFEKNKTLIAMNPSGHYLDLGLKALAPFLSKLAVLSLNLEEAQMLAGGTSSDIKKVLHILHKVVPGLVVVSDGPRGVVVSDGKHIYQAGTYREKAVVDRTGAGDAFGSGFVAGLIHRGIMSYKTKLKAGDIEYAIKLGSANGTSVVEHIGAEEGILRKKDMQNSRWKNLSISKKPL